MTTKPNSVKVAIFLLRCLPKMSQLALSLLL